MPFSNQNRHLDMAVANAVAFTTALGTTRGHDVILRAAYLSIVSGQRIGNRILLRTPTPRPSDVEEIRASVRDNSELMTVVEDSYASVDLVDLGKERQFLPVMVRAPRVLDAIRGTDITQVTDSAELRVAESAIVHGFPLARVQPYLPTEVLPVGLLDYPGFEVFIARRDDQVVGACVTMVAGTCAAVYWVTTMPNHRSRGVARALMVAILNHHAERPMTLSSSAAGKPLYDSLGFEVAGQAQWWV